MTSPKTVLVLCTGNSARSILGEMLFNHLGMGRVKAYSAGSKPGGIVNPVAIETLQKHGIPCKGSRSKSWDEFGSPGAPKIDFILLSALTPRMKPVQSGQVSRQWHTGQSPIRPMSNPLKPAA